MAVLVSVLSWIVIRVEVPSRPPPLLPHFVVKRVPAHVPSVLQMTCTLNLIAVYVVILSETAVSGLDCAVVETSRRRPQRR